MKIEGNNQRVMPCKFPLLPASKNRPRIKRNSLLILNRDLKQPRRVCRRRREYPNGVWVENVVDGGKNKYLSKLLSTKMTSFKEIRELLLLSFENETINDEEFLLLSEQFKSKNPDFPLRKLSGIRT